MNKYLLTLFILFQLSFGNNRNPTELNIYVHNLNPPVSCTITLTAIGNIYDEDYDLTSQYNSAQKTSSLCSFEFLGDHVDSQTGGEFTFGYGIYQIQVSTNSSSYYINVDIADCNYRYESPLTSDMGVIFDLSSNSISIKYSGDSYPISNGETEHIWDQPGGPTPDAYCFSVTPVSGLNVQNSSNHPSLSWLTSGQGITYDVWRSNDGNNSVLIQQNISNTSFVDQAIQLCCGSDRHEHCYDVYANYQGNSPSNYDNVCITSKSNSISRQVFNDNNNSQIKNKVFPNPFNSTVQYYFSLKASNEIIFSVNNIQGQRISAESLGAFKKGDHHFNWNADAYPSGVYYITIIGNNFSDTKKVLLVK